MSRLTRDGTAKPVSRDQILRHVRGQGNIHFPCSADHEQDWQPYQVDPYYSAIIYLISIHTNCTTYFLQDSQTYPYIYICVWAGTLIRMSGGQLLKRIVPGNLEGAVRKGRGGKEKEWTDCVQSDIRAFSVIAGDWKVTALKAEVGVETVVEGGRRFMAAWRKG